MTAKKTRTTRTRGATRAAAPPPASPDPALPIGALVEIADWVLDHARLAADGDPDDVGTVERVRAYVHAAIAGRPVRVPPESDFLTAIALAVAAMEHRHGIAGLGELVAQSLDRDVRVAPPCVVVRRPPRIAPHLYCMP